MLKFKTPRIEWCYWHGRIIKIKMYFLHNFSIRWIMFIIILCLLSINILSYGYTLILTNTFMLDLYSFTSICLFFIKWLSPSKLRLHILDLLFKIYLFLWLFNSLSSPYWLFQILIKTKTILIFFNLIILIIRLWSPIFRIIIIIIILFSIEILILIIRL